MQARKNALKKPKVKPEWREQKALVRWFNLQYPMFEGLLNCFHTGSENWGPVKGKIMKDMGVKSDYPDLVLFMPRSLYSALFIEVKTMEGYARKSQVERHEALKSQGYKVEVCKGWEHGTQIIKDYITNL